MGQTTSRIEHARTKHKSKPRSSKSIEEKKIKLAQTTGVLALTDSKLKEIPISIISNGDLQEKLRSLDLSRNQITRVPTEMNTVRFSNMKSLKLQSNAIHSLPDLSQLMALTKVVSVRQNKITGSREPQAIAEQILAHSNIDILNLDGNAITKLQLEAMNGISQFMERRKELKDKGILAGISADMSLCGLD
ncbi:hypothetical protein ABG067_002992 [Albugo candida]